ncbi:MAG: PEGA domain-containing protein [Myxococcaceae bacterium]
MSAAGVALGLGAGLFVLFQSTTPMKKAPQADIAPRAPVQAPSPPPKHEPVAAEGEGKLALRSQPPGASVRLNGRVVGTTPLEVTLVAGTAHFITFEKSGFRSEERELQPLLAGETKELEAILAATLSKEPLQARPTARVPSSGFLTLSTEPWTKVSVGEELLGSTPLYKAKLSAGVQTLTLVNEGKGIKVTHKVTIKGGEVTRLDLKLP